MDTRETVSEVSRLSWKGKGERGQRLEDRSVGRHSGAETGKTRVVSGMVTWYSHACAVHHSGEYVHYNQVNNRNDAS